MMLKRGQYSKYWMLEIIRQERRNACKQVLNQTMERPGTILVSASASSIPRGSSYWVDLDIDCPVLIDSCLKQVADHLPEFIMITCRDGIYNHALTDAHLKHIQHVPFVAIPGNVGITDAGLEYLSNARVLWLGGCTGISGSNLPELVYKSGSLSHMLSIKWKGGWGPHTPFNTKVIRWLEMQEKQGLIVEQW